MTTEPTAAEIDHVKGRPVVGAERTQLAEDLAEQYRADRTLSIRALAAINKRSYGTTRALLLESGAKLRDRGGYRGVPRKKTKSAPTGEA